MKKKTDQCWGTPVNEDEKKSHTVIQSCIYLIKLQKRLPKWTFHEKDKDEGFKIKV